MISLEHISSAVSGLSSCGSCIPSPGVSPRVAMSYPQIQRPCSMVSSISWPNQSLAPFSYGATATSSLLALVVSPNHDCSSSTLSFAYIFSQYTFATMMRIQPSGMDTGVRRMEQRAVALSATLQQQLSKLNTQGPIRSLLLLRIPTVIPTSFQT